MTEWKQRIDQLKVETYAIALAYRDPRTPWYAKLLAACVVAYAISPIDLIPDFIPVVGVLDDLIIVPIGTMLALKMIPKEVMTECREKARVQMGPDCIKEGNVFGGSHNHHDLLPGCSSGSPVDTQDLMERFRVVTRTCQGRL